MLAGMGGESFLMIHDFFFMSFVQIIIRSLGLSIYSYQLYLFVNFLTKQINNADNFNSSDEEEGDDLDDDSDGEGNPFVTVRSADVGLVPAPLNVKSKNKKSEAEGGEKSYPLSSGSNSERRHEQHNRPNHQQRQRLIDDDDDGGDVQSNEHEEEQVEDDEKENLQARREEQEEYAQQLMVFVRGRLGMFTATKHQPSGSGSSSSGGSATAAPPTATVGGSSASGGAEASKMLLENLQKQFGTGGSPNKGKYATPQKNLRARRRESRLWNSIGEIEDDFTEGNAGVGEEVKRAEEAVEE
ncbi:hypothetical protein BGX38DRAFT_679478 [Terfezia claveryi]|nr:hypothetical protein BGX38DRAFT_679478 [Terfezia claveryi]